LEFSAGGDQRITATRVGTIKAQHLNTTIYRTITMCIVIEVLGGSVGGLYKRFRPPPARPQRPLRLNNADKAADVNHESVAL